MRKILVIGLWLLVVIFAGTSELGEPALGKVTIIKVAEANQNPYQELYEEMLYPSVKITAGMSTGSGVIINHKDTKDTKNTIYVLTAAHVVGDESEVTVTFYTYHQDTKTPSLPLSLSAFVVITDTIKDLALIQIKSQTSNIKDWPTARLAPRDYTPYIFTPVWVIGCSLGLKPRPSFGHLSALGDSVANYWEVSAPIVPGNSGGGVFLKDTHELIGIAVWVRVYQGQLITTMAGIVPIQTVYEFLDSYKGQIGSPDTAGQDNR